MVSSSDPCTKPVSGFAIFESVYAPLPLQQPGSFQEAVEEIGGSL